MGLPFNTDRPKVSEEEIKKNQDFDKLVQKFKEQSVKQAKGDESWWNNKVIRYSAVIAGVTVVCTITYNSLFNSKTSKQTTKNDYTTTSVKNTTTKPRIAPPAPKLAVPNRSFVVNNSKGGTLNHPGGSQIQIPSGSFVDSRGKSIVGDVTIEYREFHDLSAVIGSGIPMSYDSAGVTRHLQTAGMFQIAGSANGKSVFIAPGKELEINLASKTNQPGFHQYVFDTTSGNWQYLRADKAQPLALQDPIALQKSIAQLKKEVEVLLPKKTDSVKVHYTQQIKQLPVYSAPLKPRTNQNGRPTFKLDGSYSEFPELATFNNVIFEVGPENKNYTKDLHEITWSDLKISQGPQKGVNYLLNLKSRSRSEKLIVYPVLSGKDLENATTLYSQKLEEYQNRLEAREESEKRLLAELENKQTLYLAEQKEKKAQYDRERRQLQEALTQQRSQTQQAEQNAALLTAKANRVFRIASFGLYNSDCPHSAPTGQLVRPVFVKNSDFPLRPLHVYLIDHTHQTVFDLPVEQGFAVKVDKNTEYSFCVFLADRVFISSKEITETAFRNTSNKFTVTEIEGGLENAEIFKKSLGI